MKIILFSYFAIFLAFVVTGCSREEIPPPPETESERLNEMLRNAPISWINLKEAEPDTLIIPEQNIFKNQYTAANESLSGNFTQVKIFDDHLIALDYSLPDVVTLNRDGTPLKKIDGEFQRPASIMSDGKDLYIYDDGMKSIQVYDKDFEFQHSIPFKDSYYSHGSVAMNQQHIAFQHEEASGFRVSPTDHKLLSVVSINEPGSILFEAFPRIVPSGKHPGGFNNLLFSMNQNSEIVAAYPALPYLFIYRNFEHQQSIVLDAIEFETIDNPSLGPFEPVFGEAVRVTSLMSHVYLKDNGDILLFCFDLLHHLKNRSDEGYNYHRSYALFREDNGEQIQSISSMDAFPDEPNRLYTIGSGVLFEFGLPE